MGAWLGRTRLLMCLVGAERAQPLPCWHACSTRCNRPLQLGLALPLTPPPNPAAPAADFNATVPLPYAIRNDQPLVVGGPDGLLRGAPNATVRAALNVSVVAQPSQGNVSLGTDGSFNYTPNANAIGPDTFFVKVASSDGGCARLAVTVNIGARARV